MYDNTSVQVRIHRQRFQRNSSYKNYKYVFKPQGKENISLILDFLFLTIRLTSLNMGRQRATKKSKLNIIEMKILRWINK